MVVITITMVLTGVGITAYTSYDMREKTKQTANEILSSITLARSMAITNQKTDGFTGDLDYVAVVLDEGIISAFPVNKTSGTGPSYFSKKISDDSGAVVSTINFGGLQFGATTGKLLLKKTAPSFEVYPPQATSIGVSFTITSSSNSSDKKMITVSPIGNTTLVTINN